MHYNIALMRAAEKELLRLEKNILLRIANAIDELAKDPLIESKKLKTPFSGYRLRVGDYRILFTVEKWDVTIYSIKHRKEAYRL
jgi:mRNA interferase RelE/StbE